MRKDQAELIEALENIDKAINPIANGAVSTIASAMDRADKVQKIARAAIASARRPETDQAEAPKALAALRKFWREAQYVPGDNPVIPWKVGVFIDQVGKWLDEQEAAPVSAQAEAPKADVAKLIREYRPSMPADVMHLWAKDVVAVLSSLATPVPAQAEGWTKKPRGNAKIHKHPSLDHAVVENPWGVFYRGQSFKSVDSAKAAALSPHNPTGE